MTHAFYYFLLDGLLSGAAGYSIKLYQHRNKTLLESVQFIKIVNWLKNLPAQSENTIRRDAELLKQELSKLF